MKFLSNKNYPSPENFTENLLADQGKTSGCSTYIVKIMSLSQWVSYAFPPPTSQILKFWAIYVGNQQRTETTNPLQIVKV